MEIGLRMLRLRLEEADSLDREEDVGGSPGIRFLPTRSPTPKEMGGWAVGGGRVSTPGGGSLNPRQEDEKEEEKLNKVSARPSSLGDPPSSVRSPPSFFQANALLAPFEFIHAASEAPLTLGGLPRDL